MWGGVVFKFTKPSFHHYLIVIIINLLQTVSAVLLSPAAWTLITLRCFTCVSLPPSVFKAWRGWAPVCFMPCVLAVVLVWFGLVWFVWFLTWFSVCWWERSSQQLRLGAENSCCSYAAEMTSHWHVRLLAYYFSTLRNEEQCTGVSPLPTALFTFMKSLGGWDNYHL